MGALQTELSGKVIISAIQLTRVREEIQRMAGIAERRSERNLPRSKDGGRGMDLYRGLHLALCG